MQAQHIESQAIVASSFLRSLTIQAIEAEAVHGADDICIRFCELGIDVWMDAQALAEAGGPYEWVRDNCELDAEQLDLVTNHDYEVVDDEGGIVGAFCHYGSGWGSCDWLGLSEAYEAIESSHLEEEVFLAGLKLDIPVDRIEDAYCGAHRSDTDFAEQLWEDCGYLSEMPEYAQNYIDWESVARDLMFEHSESNGHYFSDYY